MIICGLIVAAIFFLAPWLYYIIKEGEWP